MRLQLSGLVLVFGFLCSCTSPLYHPEESFFTDPSQIDPEPIIKEIPNRDGLALSAWYFDANVEQAARAIVVFAHGNAQNISTHYQIISWVLAENIDYLIFDYQGFGKSPGKPSPKNTVEDTQAVIAYVQNEFPEIPIFLLGQSIGAAVMLRATADLQDRRNIRGLIVDGSFHSYQEAGRKALASLWLTWPLQWISKILLSDRWAPKGRIQKISPIPLLIFHGEDDQVIPLSLGIRVYEEARQPKEFFLIEKGTHMGSFWDQNTQRRFVQFVEEQL